ncbi:hypothetical protein BC941DRAFT_509761 [Chlamydoabsidia padenii]|nr:hypothetical protein BC941DRAFT_509761 [Chlamydoabsidia padenii]
MSLLITHVKVLTTRRSATLRPFSSTIFQRKEQLGGSPLKPSCSNNTVDEKEKINNTNASDAPESFVAPKEQHVSFMPVIHIPQTEFAHNAFFSLYRPLLGLENDTIDKPFFSDQPDKDHVDVDEQISNYMMTLRPFEVPAPPTMNQVNQQDVKAKGPMQQQQDEEDYYMDYSLPMYYMPDSDDIVDYLTTMQHQLVRQNAFYDSSSHLAFTRSTGRTRRRLTTSVGFEKLAHKTSLSSIITTSRYQKRHRQGLYRHRWNK